MQSLFIEEIDGETYETTGEAWAWSESAAAITARYEENDQ